MSHLDFNKNLMNPDLGKRQDFASRCSMKKIFFLDDSPDFLFLAKKFVENRCDCLALTTENFESTKKNESSILDTDIAFLDINLGANSPSGVDVYHWMRNKGYKKPIYFLTAHAESSSEIRSIEASGEVTVLSKPLRPDTLKNIIESQA
jgi:response regulator RpfG family c-di-GMP phosphodiesterase